MSEHGILKRVGRIEDEDGKTVLEAIVHFYDGNCPAVQISAIWNRTPVQIVDADAALSTPQNTAGEEGRK